MSTRIAELEARLASVEQRLALLERGAAKPATPVPEDVDEVVGDGAATVFSAHIGRVLLIFGGAYFLRAITDYGFVPTAVGLLMGATYAAFWLFMANRMGGDDGQRTKAEFFGCTSVVLGLPLLHEATTQFPLLSGSQGVVALAVYFVCGLGVAMRHRLTVLAWFVTVGSIGAAVASLVASRTAIPAVSFLLLVGLATLWAVYWRRWMGLRWIGAIGANLGVATLIGLSLTDNWQIASEVAFAFAVILLSTYLASITFHTHVRGQIVSVFESVQATLAAAVVLGSAVVAVKAGRVELFTVGLMGVILGIGGYGLAIARDTRKLRYPNFFYYSTFGLAFLLVGTGLLLPTAWAAIFWALLAIGMAYSSQRTGWVSLSLQCTILLLAAGAGSGLLATGLEALAGDPANGWAPATVSHLLVAAATVACLFIPVAQHSERWGVLEGLPQLTVLALSVWEVGGLFIAIGASMLAGAGTDDPNLGVLAALRTSVLSMAAVTLALSSQHQRWPEARWLVYPVLLLVGFKLFVEDFPHGNPASLFVAFGFVGGALLLTARLLKRDSA